jgi:hypothetical protein
MNLYQFTIEVNDGAAVFEDKRLVMAPDDRAAARFARITADNWQPNARLDSEHDIYSGPDGWPQWILSHCTPLTHLAVPVAGAQVQVRVVLLPCGDSMPTEITRALDILASLADPSLAGRSVRWLLSKHLGMSDRELSSMHQALDEVRHALAGCSEQRDEDAEESG